MGELTCPICGKSAIRDDFEGHEILWVGNGWKLICPTEIEVKRPLSSVKITGLGLKVKHG